MGTRERGGGRRVQFGVLSERELRGYAVCEVTTACSRGGKDQPNTPYDPRLGVMDNGARCVTCRGTNHECPGHYGFIALAHPVFNPKFFDVVYKILRCVCLACASPLITRQYATIRGVRGSGPARFSAAVKECEKVRVCPNPACGAPVGTLRPRKDAYGKLELRVATPHGQTCQVLTARDVYDTLTCVSGDTMKLLGFNADLDPDPRYRVGYDGKTHLHEVRPEDLVFRAFPVIPIAARPWVIRDGEYHDDDLTAMYNSILRYNKTLRDAAPGTPAFDVAYDALANAVATLIDNQKDTSRSAANGRTMMGLTERLNGKKGRGQQNVVAKRVDFSARTVVVGAGMSCRVGEVGVPRMIARTLTYPVPVTDWNVGRLQALVDRGAARYVRRGGRKFKLDIVTAGFTRPYALQVGDVVERCMQDGDMFIFNRQPTLRLESMVAMKAKLLPPDEYAWRIPVPSTIGFNCDHDGDEMNGHAPQSQEAIVEMELLMPSEEMLMTPQRNGPIAGMVQDGLSGAFLLTAPGERMPWAVFMDCVTSSIGRPGGGAPPGDLLASWLRRSRAAYPDAVEDDGGGGVQLTSGARAHGLPGTLALSVLFPPGLYYRKRGAPVRGRDTVVIENGVLLPGTAPLTKAVIGNKVGSVVHTVWMEWGAARAQDLLSDMCHFIDRWFSTRGFSIGIQDCLVDPEEDGGDGAPRVGGCAKVARRVAQAHIKVEALAEKHAAGLAGVAATEEAIITELNNAMNVASTIPLARGDDNALVVMCESGAKGSAVNGAQIAQFVGQQNIVGARVGLKLSDGRRTLPYFPVGEHTLAPEPRGFVQEGFLEGLSPHATFFHAMSGRVGVCDTAIRTKTTGYGQKRIGKKLEDMRVDTMGCVRDGLGRVVQFVYGGDGLDPKRVYPVPDAPFPFPVDPRAAARRVAAEVADTPATAVPTAWPYTQPPHSLRLTPRPLTDRERTALVARVSAATCTSLPGGAPLPPPLARAVHRLKTVLDGMLRGVAVPEAAIPVFSRRVFRAMEAAKAAYGAPVGLTATMSIGEPTTQLLLNTHQSTGQRSVKDAVGGVPRLEELLGATERPRRPIYTIYHDRPDVAALRAAAAAAGTSTCPPQGSPAPAALAYLRMVRHLGWRMEGRTVADILAGRPTLHRVVGDAPRRPPLPLGCTVYAPPAWRGLRRALGWAGDRDGAWVLRFRLDPQGMYRYTASPTVVARQIHKALLGVDAVTPPPDAPVWALPSPAAVGEVEVHVADALADAVAPSVWDRATFRGRPGEAPLRGGLGVYHLTRYVVRSLVEAVGVSGLQGRDGVGFLCTHVADDPAAPGEWFLFGEANPATGRGTKKGRKPGTGMLARVLTTPGVDRARTTTDDIWEVYHTLGIEATRQFYVEEVTRILCGNGTWINPRHIALLVDSMTRGGDVTSVRREGIGKEVGVLSRCMFERTTENFGSAAAFAQADRLTSLSACVTMGERSLTGTGSVTALSSDAYG